MFLVTILIGKKMKTKYVDTYFHIIIVHSDNGVAVIFLKAYF